MPHHSHRSRFAILVCLFGGVVWGQQPAASPSPADTLFQSAVTQLSQGKFPEAEDSFRKLAEMEPDNSRGTVGIAEVWAAQKKTDEALVLLQDEAAKHPDRTGLYVGIGNLAVRIGKYDLAIGEYQRVLDRINGEPKGSADLYLRMGEAYRLKGDLDFAINVLRKAQALQPANSAILNTLAFTLDTAGQKQAAGEQYRKLLELEPNNPTALNNLAYLLADTGSDTGLALALSLRARQLLPKQPVIADTLGWVYVKMNRAEEAIPLFREAVEKDQSRATYRYHLATALEMRGDHDGAKKESEAALKSNPSKDDQQKINELLQKLNK